MTLDCTNLKPGDRVRLRNGEICTVKENDGTSMPIFLGHEHGWNYANGSYTDEDEKDDRDIIEILPPEPPKFAINGKPWPVQPDPNRPLPRSASATLTIDGKFDGVKHPPAINWINGKRYVPADSPSLFTGQPFGVIAHPSQGVIALRYGDKLFTPADAWPEPITTVSPTSNDADPEGNVQSLDSDGDWMRVPWDCSGLCVHGWARTSDWKPKPTPAHTREEVLDLLRHDRVADLNIGDDLLASIITHLKDGNK